MPKLVAKARATAGPKRAAARGLRSPKRQAKSAASAKKRGKPVITNTAPGERTCELCGKSGED